MRRASSLAVLVTATAIWSGCGAASTSAPSADVISLAPLLPETSPYDVAAGATVASATDVAVPEPVVDTSTLPPPPWSDAPVSTDAVPEPLLAAWAHALNRAECAPLVPIGLGAGEGARAREAELEGGWAVEFDRRGMPGVRADGEICEHCGRGVFGIAGTNLTPEDLVGEESTTDAPAPSFADGSHLSIEPAAEGEQVAAATLTVRGQGCVYQVWSFLGEEHVRELVSSLRLVDVQAPAAPVVASR